MEQLIKIHSKRFLIAFVFAFTIVALNACKVVLLPSYSATISEQIDNTAKTIDKFYLSMLETTSVANDGRAFNKFADKYVEIEVELNSLLNKNKIRPLNKNSIRICEITLQLWQKYKQEHKDDNTLSDGLIKLNNKTFSDLLYAMQVAEKGKGLVTNPPD